MMISSETAQILTLVGVGVVSFFVARLSDRLDRISKQLNSNILTKHGDTTHDELVDGEVARSLEWYVKRRDQLETEKKRLPRIDLWALTDSNWEKKLIESAETLRGLISEAYGNGTSDGHHINMTADRVRLDIDLAKDLVSFAHLKNDINRKGVEWLIKRIEVLGCHRKREMQLGPVAHAEFELRALGLEMDEMQSQIPQVKKAVFDSFRAARDREAVSDEINELY